MVQQVETFLANNEVTFADDAPGDDRSDAALKARADVYAQADSLQWLMEGAQQQEDQQPQRPAPVTTISPVTGREVPYITIGGEPEGSFLRDVATGVGEMPRQALGGIRDAAQSILDFGDWLNSQAGLGGPQIVDPETGEFDLRLVGGEELAEMREKGKGRVELPDVGEPETIAGAGVRAISQFLAPFGAFSKAMGGLGGATVAGTTARAAGAGAATDFFAFPAHEERLSDLIQEFPSLENPVSEWLAADEDDLELEGRLKNAIEGLGLGALSEALFRGLRAYRRLRKAQREGGPEAVAEAVRTASDEQMLREATEFRLLGSPDPEHKLSASLKDTDVGVPQDVAARALTEAGLTPLEGAQDVFINFARITEPEDIQRVINDTAQAFSEEIDAARRGVRSNVETSLSADHIDAWETLLARRMGEPLNAEQSVAARQLWATSANRLAEIAEVAAANPTPENLFQFRRMLATHHAIQKEVIAARSETARALQSWAIPVGGPHERMRDIESALESFGGERISARMARDVLSAFQMGGPGAVSRYAEKSVYAKTMGSIREYWINSILSGPTTHLVNMISNTGVIALSIAERAVASRVGGAVEVGEAAAQLAGLRGGAMDLFRLISRAPPSPRSLQVARQFTQGASRGKIDLPRERYISSGAWNLRSDSWPGRAIDGTGAVVNLPGRALLAEDEIFKTLGYRMELHVQAHRMVMQEVREGKIGIQDIKARKAEILDNPPEAIRMEAVANAAYQTFTSEPGPWTREVRRLIGMVPGLRYITPFINTPANILKYTFERTPLAPLTAKYRNAIARGGADADLARTKLAMGTLALMVGVDLAMNGLVTGSGPSNTAERQNWRRQGFQPYSIRLGDTWYAFNRMDPLGYHLGISGDLAEYAMNAEAEGLEAGELWEAFAAATFSVAENITSKSYLSGLSDFVGAVENPERNAEYFLSRFGSGFVPNILNTARRFDDPVLRHTHDLISAMKARLPYWSEELPARRDLWGRPIAYQSDMGRAYDAMSPFYASNYEPEPIDLAMVRDGWFIGMGGYQFTIDGQTVSLRNRPDIKNRYYELRGGTKPSEMGADGLLDTYGDLTLLETLNGIVTGNHHLSDRWAEAETPDERETIARRVFRDYSRFAKRKLFQEFPWIEETAERLKRQRLGREAVAP